MRTFLDTLLHATDIFCGVPQHIILSSDQKQFPMDLLNLDHFFFRDRVRGFGIIKQFS